MGKILNYFKVKFAKKAEPFTAKLCKSSSKHRISRVCALYDGEFDFTYKVVGNVNTTPFQFNDMGLVEERDFVRRVLIGEYMLTAEAFQAFVIYQHFHCRK